MDKEIKITFEKITPAKANEILFERNADNYRNLKGNAARLYGKEMKEGRWMFNGDTIRFDWNGNLIDGQHRLEAIKNTGIPQEFIIVKGLNPECAQTIDIGYKKSVEDYLNWYLKKQEKMYTKGATAVVKLAMTLHRKNKQIGHSSAYSCISNTMIVDRYLEDSIHFNEAVSFGKEISSLSKKVLKPSYVGGIYYYLVYDLGIDEGIVREFFNKFASYNTLERTPFTRAYEILADTKKLGRSGVDIMNVYINCWNSRSNSKNLNGDTEWFNLPKSVTIETPVEVV